MCRTKSITPCSLFPVICSNNNLNNANNVTNNLNANQNDNDRYILAVRSRCINTSSFCGFSDSFTFVSCMRQTPIRTLHCLSLTQIFHLHSLLPDSNLDFHKQLCCCPILTRFHSNSFLRFLLLLNCIISRHILQR